MAIVGSPCYWAGDKSLMKCELDRVTKWCADDDFNFIKKDLRRDRIKWVVKRRKVSRLHYGELRFFEEYALYRKKEREHNKLEEIA